MMRLFDFLQPTDLTRNQRWGHYFALAFCAIALVIGLNLREGLLTATTIYVDNEAGIRLEYPANWFLEGRDNRGNSIFRVRDLSRIGYKTTVQISIYPFTSGMTPVNLLEDLSLLRAQTLSNYRVLSTQDYVMPNGEPATLREYVFVDNETNPFLEALPTVVIGRDIVVVRRGQAVLVTFLADASTYDLDLAIFDRFIRSLDF